MSERSKGNSALPADARGRITLLSLFVLGAFIVLPILALRRLGLDWRWTGAYILVMNVLAYGSYALDKRRAVAQEWRFPETRLHLLELLGGWPAAFLAQRRLRHKCSKGSYQVVFWVIVLIYQFIAIDSLLDWRFSRATLQRVHASV